MSEHSSYCAINDYINIEGNYFMHKTKVVVIKNNKVIYDGIINVRAHIETNDSIVDIIWDGKEEKNFYTYYNGKYSNVDIEFDDGKLIIYANDRQSNSICITVY